VSAIVAAPCRLHFGLLHVPTPGFTHWKDGSPVRKFGGVGLMVEEPEVTVHVEPASEWSAAGSHGERACEFARRVWSAAPVRGFKGLRVTAAGPPEHVGLGVGTALGLAVARAVTTHSITRSWTVTELARLAGRGERSRIGIFGFERGGLILDAGKEDESDAPRLHSRADFPEAWRVVLVRPDVAPAWYGERERTAFRRSRPPAAVAALTRLLDGLATGAIEPAVRAADFRTFTHAVYEYNRRAGEPFSDDQGGVYAGPEVTGVIETLRNWGVVGLGQSSWGPTVFAFAADPAEAAALAGRVRDELPGLADVTVTAANNCGARSMFLK
jgi:beta-ribofuranosylaminobenzene 5'-phosphate synthase